MSIIVKSFQLKVISALLTNIGAGLLIIPLTIPNIATLTVSISFAIVCLYFAMKIEEILELYD